MNAFLTHEQSLKKDNCFVLQSLLHPLTLTLSLCLPLTVCKFLLFHNAIM